MATRRVNDSNKPQRRSRPGTTPEAHENKLIALSMDAAEEMLRSGNAPAQVVTHFLRLGSSSEKLSQAHKHEEINLLRIKAETLASQKKTEELMIEAMNAFRGYAGHPPEDSDEDYDS